MAHLAAVSILSGALLYAASVAAYSCTIGASAIALQALPRRRPDGARAVAARLPR